MVRRWSYINSVNTIGDSSFGGMRHAAFDATITATMYLRKSYSVPTKLTRRRWSRRKHIYGWLPLANIIKDWAHAYRFYRNYNKAIFNQHLTRNSFLAFSLVSVKNSIPCLHKNSELLVVSTFSSKILRYFNHFMNPRIRLLRLFRNINPSVISYNPKYSPLDDISDYPFVTPLLNHQVTTTARLGLDQKNLGQPIQLILPLLHKISVKSVYTLYRLLTLLAISRCFTPRN